MSISSFARHICAAQCNTAMSEAISIHVVDAFTSLAAGMETHEGRQIADFFNDKNPLTLAAGMTAVIRYTECDDIEVPTCLTPGSIAIPAAAVLTSGPRALAAAIEAGYATGLALSRAIGGVNALTHGVWPSLFAAPAIAAATASVAMELDEEQTAHALALALAGVSGRSGRPQGSPSGRWLLLGEATLKGLRAAAGARAGFKGDLNLMSEDWLLRHVPADIVDPTWLEAPAKNAVLSVGIKPFVTARQGANAIHAFCALLSNGLRPETVRTVDVFLPPSAVPVATAPFDPAVRITAISNLGLHLGIAAFERKRLFEVARTNPFLPSTLKLSEVISVRADSALADIAPHSFAARLVVHTSDQAIETRCEALPGDAGDQHQLPVLQRKIEEMEVAGIVGDLFDALQDDREADRTLATVFGKLGHRIDRMSPASSLPN